MARDICIDRILSRSRIHGNEPAYSYKKNGQYVSVNWAEYGKNIIQCAAGLLTLGLQPRNCVAILSFNRPEWTTACLAAQMADGISVGVYTLSSAVEVAHVISHSNAQFVFIESKKRWTEQIEPHLSEYEEVKYFILMNSDENIDDPRVLTFQQLLQTGQQKDASVVLQVAKQIAPQSIATLIYTSGTTGAPKGVMLSHQSIAWTVKTAVSVIHVAQGDTMISYLPLAHIAEQVFSVYVPAFSGTHIYFAESMEALPNNLKEAQPTLFFAVPRVYEKFYDKIRNKLAETKGLQKLIFNWAQKVATRAWGYSHRNHPLPLLLSLQYKLAKKLIFNRLKPALGLGRTRICVSGAAPLSQAIIEFFTAIDLPIYEVYGQSEDCGPTSINVPGATQLGTVGRPLPGVEVKIADDGEILVKGPNVFSGYYKDEAATKETFRNGWLCSGDIGELDAQGYLRITDRKKDLLITAGGKNIAPQNLENRLKQIPLVSLAVVVGDRRKYLSALLTPNKDNLFHFASEQGISFTDMQLLVKESKVLQALQKEVEKINQYLAPVEQIKRFELLSQDFSVEAGELTPTMKLKRKVINSKYSENIERLYR